MPPGKGPGKSDQRWGTALSCSGGAQAGTCDQLLAASCGVGVRRGVGGGGTGLLCKHLVLHVAEARADGSAVSAVQRRQAVQAAASALAGSFLAGLCGLGRVGRPTLPGCGRHNVSTTLTRARRLLESYVAEARKHGVRPHQVTAWVRRKLGAHISVWRKRSDGSFGCATPCVLCQRELKRYDLRVHCSQDTGWFVGRLSEEHAPQAQLTTAQRRLFAIGSHHILDLRLQKYNKRFGVTECAVPAPAPHSPPAGAPTERAPPAEGPAPARLRPGRAESHTRPVRGRSVAYQ